MTERLTWSSRFVFIMAAAGAAVGLGNIWKFPYTAGSHGGGAFVVIYLIAVIVISIPILVTEFVIGRIGNAPEPSTAIANVARKSGVSTKWGAVAMVGVLAAVLVLSFYFVIAGWVAYYAVHVALSGFIGLEAQAISNFFSATSGDPKLTTMWHTIAVGVTWLIVTLGMKDGVERVARFLMPLLFGLVIVNVGYAAFYGDLPTAIAFLFDFNFDSVSTKTVFYACGQAFFTVGAGSCVMVVFGSYLSDDTSILGSSVRIALLDTMVALLAGLAIFPLVFANGLSPGEGPGLLFVTLPIIFAQSPGGSFIGGLFFLMVAIAALTSAIAIAQPPVAVLQQRFGLSRIAASTIALFIMWLLGLGTVCSFSTCANFYPLGFIEPFSDLTIFGIMEVVAINICLPLGSLLLAIFVGWKVPFEILETGLGDDDTALVRGWYYVVKFVLPPLIVVIMVTGFAG